MKHHTNTVSCIITARLKKGEDFVISGGFDGRVGIWDVRKRHSSTNACEAQSEVLKYAPVDGPAFVHNLYSCFNLKSF